MRRQTPIFIVTSSRPRVGKTLIARALIEYLDARRRTVSAFDLNPDDNCLLAHLPRCTEAASIGDTRGEVALFDRLVLLDDVPKVIDLAPSIIGRFFAVIQKTDFTDECRRRGIAPIVLFVAAADERARQCYALLSARLPDLALVAVLNEVVPNIARRRADFPATRWGGEPVVVPAISLTSRPVINRPGFSFVSYAANATGPTAELHNWTRRLFLTFHELEVRLLLRGLQPRSELATKHQLSGMSTQKIAGSASIPTPAE
jgi:hypothetical protein